MSELDRLDVSIRVGEILNRQPAVGVIRDGALDSFHGHGLADIASHTPVTDGTVFRIASLSRPSRRSP